MDNYTGTYHNPWLDIPLKDYEDHMSDNSVGQMPLLNQLTKNYLEKQRRGLLYLSGSLVEMA